MVRSSTPTTLSDERVARIAPIHEGGPGEEIAGIIAHDNLTLVGSISEELDERGGMRSSVATATASPTAIIGAAS